jgi:hypothetical protein
MNKALMDGLVAKFLQSYDAPAKDATWQQHSATFRRFWHDQVLGKGTGTIPDDVCDVVIRIFHTNRSPTSEDKSTSSVFLTKCLKTTKKKRKRLIELFSSPLGDLRCDFRHCRGWMF